MFENKSERRIKKMVECIGGLHGRSGQSADGPTIHLDNGQYLSSESHRRVRTVYRAYHFDLNEWTVNEIDRRTMEERRSVEVLIVYLKMPIDRLVKTFPDNTILLLPQKPFFHFP